jgi:hypothetical protein
MRIKGSHLLCQMIVFNELRRVPVPVLEESQASQADALFGVISRSSGCLHVFEIMTRARAGKRNHLSSRRKLQLICMAR